MGPENLTYTWVQNLSYENGPSFWTFTVGWLLFFWNHYIIVFSEKHSWKGSQYLFDTLLTRGLLKGRSVATLNLDQNRLSAKQHKQEANQPKQEQSNQKWKQLVLKKRMFQEAFFKSKQQNRRKEKRKYERDSEDKINEQQGILKRVVEENYRANMTFWKGRKKEEQAKK